MIKVKNTHINKDMIDILNELIDKDINATSAFKLNRILKELSSIIEDKTKSEKKIFDKYIVKDENGNVVMSKDENGNDVPDTYLISEVDSFSKEMNELMDIENELNFDMLNFDDLGLKTAKIKDIIKIDFLFV